MQCNYLKVSNMYWNYNRILRNILQIQKIKPNVWVNNEKFKKWHELIYFCQSFEWIFFLFFMIYKLNMPIYVDRNIENLFNYFLEQNSRCTNYPDVLVLTEIRKLLQDIKTIELSKYCIFLLKKSTIKHSPLNRIAKH